MKAPTIPTPALSFPKSPRPVWVRRQDFFASPVGRLTSTPHCLAWYPSLDLRVMAVWDEPGEADLSLLQQLLVRVHDGPPSPHVVFSDATRLEAVHEDVYTSYLAYIVGHAAQLRRSIHRTALLLADNAIGARIRAYLNMVDWPIPLRAFTETGACEAWLEVDGLDTAAATIAEHIEGARHTDALLWRAREHMASRVALGQGTVGLEWVAGDLGCSTRTVQRAFASSGSSFRAELRDMQLARARELLVSTDMKLSAVALEVGFRRLQNLNALFLQAHGVNAATWRRRHAATLTDATD